MTPRCETCRHWLGSQTDNWSGLCRRHSPVIASNFKRGFWPETARSDLCGDFEHISPTLAERRTERAKEEDAEEDKFLKEVFP